MTIEIYRNNNLELELSYSLTSFTSSLACSWSKTINSFSHCVSGLWPATGRDVLRCYVKIRERRTDYL
jgi:hypothetical protein